MMIEMRLDLMVNLLPVWGMKLSPLLDQVPVSLYSKPPLFRCARRGDLTWGLITYLVSWGFVTTHQRDFASEEDSQAASEDMDDELPPGDFVPGLYTALYDFEQELESEMTIRANEMVQVISRQCDGWVRFFLFLALRARYQN